VCFEMEKSFIVESKTFVFSILNGESVLRVEEKRKKISDETILSTQCSKWLVSTLEILFGFPKDQDFIKSFRERSKVFIARRGGNQASRFLEVAAFGMGGRKGFIVIPEGREGWGWRKFSGELRMAIEFRSATVGCGLGYSSAKDGKEEGSRSGLAPFWTGPSFVEVLRSDLVSAVKSLTIMGGRHSRRRASPVEPCALDLLPVVRFVNDNPWSAVDCSTLESPTVDLLDKDQPHRLLGKKPLRRSNLKFKISNLRTWSKLVIGFNMVMGQATRKFLGRITRFDQGSKHTGLQLGHFLPKSKVSRLSRLLPKMSPEISSGVFLGLSSPGGGSSSRLKTDPASSPVKSASLPVFAPLPAPELSSPTTLAAPLALAGLLVSSKFSSSTCGTGPSVFVPPLSEASVLGEKIRSPPPPLVANSTFFSIITGGLGSLGYIIL
jgi:hypothetical protein